jgi:hypothetical protein
MYSLEISTTLTWSVVPCLEILDNCEGPIMNSSPPKIIAVDCIGRGEFLLHKMYWHWVWELWYSFCRHGKWIQMQHSLKEYIFGMYTFALYCLPLPVMKDGTNSWMPYSYKFLQGGLMWAYRNFSFFSYAVNVQLSFDTELCTCATEFIVCACTHWRASVTHHSADNLSVVNQL